LWAAYVPVLLTIVIVYFGLFKFLKLLYEKHRMWFVSFIVFLSPFVLVLAETRNLLELMWVLLLTPFYGIAVLMMMFTSWMLRFYCSAFAVLMLIQLLLQRRNAVCMQENGRSFEAFLEQHLKGQIRGAASKETKYGKMWRGSRLFTKKMRKYRNLALALLLVATVAATLVSGSSLKNPTYQEALQFIASDKTDQHPYMEESYTCTNFASDFRNNALKAGFNCGCVVMYFPDSSSHALNCFNSTDRGLIFVEPQTDEVVTLRVGEVYWADLNFHSKNDTVVRFYVDWQS
jgi:hypothetical protein